MDAPVPTPITARHALKTAWQTGRHVMSRMAAAALDIALPSMCLSCREPVADEGLCPQCWAKLSFIAAPLCPRLGIPFVYDAGPGILSMEAIAHPPAFQRARAAVRYDDVARFLVHALKYQDRTDLAPAMGRWMMRAGHELLSDANMIIPVPLHWKRSWSRRYNQSGALAGVIARSSGVPIARDTLRRTRPTQQQIGLSRSERTKNVQGAFQVTPDRKAAIQGRRIVLIDDVLTTGATVDACARALLRAKAASVDVLVFARVVDILRSPI